MKPLSFLGLVLFVSLLGFGWWTSTPASTAAAGPEQTTGLAYQLPGAQEVSLHLLADPCPPCDTPTPTPCQPGAPCPTPTATPTCRPGVQCVTPTATPTCQVAAGCVTPSPTPTCRPGTQCITPTPTPHCDPALPCETPSPTATPDCPPAVPCNSPTPTCPPGAQCVTPTATDTRPPQVTNTPTATPTCQSAAGCVTPSATPTCNPAVGCASPTPACPPGVQCITPTATETRPPQGTRTPTATPTCQSAAGCVTPSPTATCPAGTQCVTPTPTPPCVPVPCVSPTPTCPPGVQCVTPTATETRPPQATRTPTATPTCSPAVGCASPTPTCPPGVQCVTPTATETRPPQATRTPTATPTCQSAAGCVTPSPTATCPAGAQCVTPTATATRPTNTPTRTSTPSATTTPPCIQPPPSMTAWYPLDEPVGPIAADIVGGNNGTHMAAPLPIAGKVAGALSFNGVNQYVQAASVPAINFGTGDFSIDTWIRTTQSQGLAVFIDKRDYTPVGYVMFLFNGRLYFQMADSAGYSNYGTAASVNVADGAWHLVAVTVARAGTPLGRLYVDGLVVHTFVPRPGNVNNTAPLWLAQHHPNAGLPTNLWFAGALDEVEFFNRFLLPGEITSLWNAGSAGKCKPTITPTPTRTPTRTPTATSTRTPTPTPTHCLPPPPNMTAWYPLDEPVGPIAADIIAGNNGLHVGGPAPIAGKVAGALSFDGVNDFVKVPNAAAINFGTGDFSIDTWIKTSQSQGLAVFIDKRSYAPVGYVLFLLNGRLYFQMADSSGFTTYGNIGSVNVADGNWHLVAVTVQRVGTPIGRLYVDGAVVHTFTPRPGNINNLAALWLGRHHPNASLPSTLWFRGALDEVEFFRRALLPGEISNLWSVGSAGKCKPGGSPTPTRTPTAGPCWWCYADVSINSAFYSYVTCLTVQGLVSGYGCGGPGEPCNPDNQPYFRPGNPVTRGQVAKIVAGAAGFADPPATQTFADVPATHPFYLWIEQMGGRGIISGYGCGGPGEPCDGQQRPYFRPYANVTRGQLAKIAANAAGYADPIGTVQQTFADVPASNGFWIYVERMILHDVISGYGCGGPGEPCDPQNRPYYRPGAGVTRGQTAKIVANTFSPDCDIPGAR